MERLRVGVEMGREEEKGRESKGSNKERMHAHQIHAQMDLLFSYLFACSLAMCALPPYLHSAASASMAALSCAAPSAVLILVR